MALVACLLVQFDGKHRELTLSRTVGLCKVASSYWWRAREIIATKIESTNHKFSILKILHLISMPHIFPNQVNNMTDDTWHSRQKNYSPSSWNIPHMMRHRIRRRQLHMHTSARLVAVNVSSLWSPPPHSKDESWPDDVNNIRPTASNFHCRHVNRTTLWDFWQCRHHKVMPSFSERTFILMWSSHLACVLHFVCGRTREPVGACGQPSLWR